MPAVLIVDDSLTVRVDLGDALEHAGFRALPCATLADARTALRSQPIALAILDVRLPDGEGTELLAQIRQDPTLATLPVLMLSSEAEIKDRVRGLQMGASDYVGKPYDTAHVIARVRQLIGAPPVRDLVLVIDDDEAWRGQLVAALAAAGYATASAASGAEGLQLAADARPTAIVVAATTTDVDGASVIRRLRLDPGLRTTPCLMLTTRDAKEAEVRALEAGADGLVHRADLDVVIARVRALLRSASSIRVEGRSLLAPKRILAVDDDPDYLALVGDRLRKKGYDVARAASGEEAIQLLGVQSVDCILLDRSMAGLGGIETCKRLKASPLVRDTPLIILTATDQRDAVIEGLGAGADDFLSKGAGFDVLAARVQGQIRRKQIEDEQRRVREQLLRSELEASEARAARALAEARATMAEELARTNAELAQANRELEAFSYSVSHDLRAPLRTVSAFTQALIEDVGDGLGPRGVDHARRVLAAASRMSDLIDALLELARIRRVPVARHPIDLGALAAAIVEELARREPARQVRVRIAPDLVAQADGRLVRVLLDNLLGNAWKFSACRPEARIELGALPGGPDEGPVFFVADDGAGFDPAEATRLFEPFVRLHAEAAYSGTGIGLATARKIIERHGGRIWAEGTPGRGARFLFTLPTPVNGHHPPGPGDAAPAAAPPAEATADDAAPAGPAGPPGVSARLAG